jgi:hypothetical protein
VRPVQVTVSAVGNSQWIPIDYLDSTFSASAAVVISSGGALTYNVQVSYDDPGPNARRAVSVSRSGTTATVTDPNHGLVAADSVVISASGSSVLDGTFAVASVTDANTYTYTVANSGPTADQGSTWANNFRVFPTSSANLTGATTRQASGWTVPFQAIRLNVSVYTSGSATMTYLQASG